VAHGSGSRIVVACKATGVSSATISELSGLPKRTVDRIYERALKLRNIVAHGSGSRW
jgi:DNA-directed RNA polymerase specialized sigma24 family protein